MRIVMIRCQDSVKFQSRASRQISRSIGVTRDSSCGRVRLQVGPWLPPLPCARVESAPRHTDTRVASVPSPFLRRLHLFHSCPPVYAHIHVAASCRLASSPHLPVASFKDVTGGDTTRCGHNGTVTITVVGTAAAIRRSGPEYVFATLRSRALAQFWCRIRTVLRELLRAGVSREQPMCAVNSVCLLRLSPSPPVEATAEGGGIAGSAHPGLICAYNRAARRRG